MRKLVIAVLVVVVLAVAVDFGAAAAAEYTVATQLRQQLELSRDPSVRITGFPFLTQALDGRYPAIDVRVSGLAVGPLHDLDVEATLHDVDAPLSQVSRGNLQLVRAEWVDGRIRVKESDLGQAIGINDLRLQQPSDQEVKELPQPVTASRGTSAVNSAWGNRAPVRMVATIDLAGQRTEVIGLGVIELTGGLVRITTSDVRLSRNGVGAANLPKEIRQTLLKTLSISVKPGGLPFAVTPTKVRVETGSVVVEGTATNVTLRQAGPGVALAPSHI